MLMIISRRRSRKTRFVSWNLASGTPSEVIFTVSDDLMELEVGTSMGIFAFMRSEVVILL